MGLAAVAIPVKLKDPIIDIATGPIFQDSIVGVILSNSNITARRRRRRAVGRRRRRSRAPSQRLHPVGRVLAVGRDWDMDGQRRVERPVALENEVPGGVRIVYRIGSGIFVSPLPFVRHRVHVQEAPGDRIVVPRAQIVEA
jgi:hypothetical protein